MPLDSTFQLEKTLIFFQSHVTTNSREWEHKSKLLKSVIFCFCLKIGKKRGIFKPLSYFKQTIPNQ